MHQQDLVCALKDKKGKYDQNIHLQMVIQKYQLAEILHY